MRTLLLFLLLGAGAFAQTTCVGCAGSGGGGAPSGSAGGDLSGTYPNPTVKALHSTAASSAGYQPFVITPSDSSLNPLAGITLTGYNVNTDSRLDQALNIGWNPTSNASFNRSYWTFESYFHTLSQGPQSETYLTVGSAGGTDKRPIAIVNYLNTNSTEVDLNYDAITFSTADSSTVLGRMVATGGPNIQWRANGTNDQEEFTDSNGNILAGTTSTGLFYETAYTAHGVLFADVNKRQQSTASGNSGQCLLSNGSLADPTFQACPGGSTIQGNVGDVQMKASSSTFAAAPMNCVSGGCVAVGELDLKLATNSLGGGGSTGFEINTSSSLPRFDFVVAGNYVGQVSSSSTTLTLKNNLATTGVIAFQTNNNDGNGPTTRLQVANSGAIIMSNLKSTGSAGGKMQVCVDTATGQLYASSSGSTCAN